MYPIPFIQGILFASPECLKYPEDLARLWLHETSRVYGDRLIDTNDLDLFQKKMLETADKYFKVSKYESSLFTGLQLA